MFFRNLTLLGGRVLRSRLVKNRQPTRAKQSKKSPKAATRTASSRRKTRGKWVPQTEEEKKFSELVRKTEWARDRAIKIALRDALAKEVRAGSNMSKQQDFYSKNRVAASKELNRIQKELKQMPRKQVRVAFPVVKPVKKERALNRLKSRASAEEAEKLFFKEIKAREAERKSLILAKMKEMKQQSRVAGTQAASETMQTTTTTTTTTTTRSKRSTRALKRTARLAAAGATSLKQKDDDSKAVHGNAEEAFYAELARLEAQRREEIAQLIAATTVTRKAESAVNTALVEEEEEEEAKQSISAAQTSNEGVVIEAPLAPTPPPKRRKPRVPKAAVVTSTEAIAPSASAPPSAAEEVEVPPLHVVTPARKTIRTQAAQSKAAVQLSVSPPRLTTVSRFSKQDASVPRTAPPPPPLLRKPVSNVDFRGKSVLVATTPARSTGLLRF